MQITQHRIVIIAGPRLIGFTESPPVVSYTTEAGLGQCINLVFSHPMAEQSSVNKHYGLSLTTTLIVQINRFTSCITLEIWHSVQSDGQ